MAQLSRCVSHPPDSVSAKTEYLHRFAAMPVKVILFEDNDSLRKGLAAMIGLNPLFELCASFENGQHAETALEVHEPDLIVTDIEMPDVDGIEIIKGIRRKNKSVKIIVLTVFEESQKIFDAICAGANGYLLKKNIGNKLFEAMQDAMQGGAPMSPSIATKVLKILADNQPAQIEYGLTTREKDILQLLVKANSYKMIAAELQISLETVKTHLKRIYEKLQVHSQAEAISKSLNEKIV